MSYMHIENLYKDQTILMFKECYAMEKIHGTSAHVGFKDGKVIFFAGGCSHEEFVKLFDAEDLKKRFEDKALPADVTIYGEAYGGKLQGMSHTYGKDLKFIAFEVKIGDCWLNVEKADHFVQSMGLEFVHYKRIPATIEAIDTEMYADSEQAIRNGIGVRKSGNTIFIDEGKMREGVVLRPIEEVTLNNGKRVISKHKRDEFKETSTARKVVDVEKLQILDKAHEIAEEWVTSERLNHILTSNNVEFDIKNTGKVISLMLEDVLREAKDEIVESTEAKKEISRSAALLFKSKLKEGIRIR